MDVPVSPFDLAHRSVFAHKLHVEMFLGGQDIKVIQYYLHQVGIAVVKEMVQIIWIDVHSRLNFVDDSRS